MSEVAGEGGGEGGWIGYTIGDLAVGDDECGGEALYIVVHKGLRALS